MDGFISDSLEIFPLIQYLDYGGCYLSACVPHLWGIPFFINILHLPEVSILLAPTTRLL